MTDINEATAASASCCSTKAPYPAVADTGRQNLLDGPSEDTATCPVMGGRTKKEATEAAGLYRDYEGTRYWFCCAGCGPAFDADPAKYAA